MIRIAAWKLAGAAFALALASGCAQRAAPVVERSPAPIKSARPQPAPVARSPVAQSPAVPQPSEAPSGFYMVKRGDTLYSIALQHGADYRDVARWNGLDDPTKIRETQLLRVRPPEGESTVEVGAARGAGRVEARPLDAASLAQQGQGDGGAKSAPKALRLPYSKENAAIVARDESKPAPQLASIAKAEPKPEPRDADGIAFIWPVKGPLLSVFSEPSSKGVDIGGKLGEPVVAAASGRVMYTGTGIRGYGKLIVIRHENGFNSVYAHNREILVKEGQSVSRGQKIAELGDTEADTPKLHFEIRKSGKPVDPLRYLPGDKPS